MGFLAHMRGKKIDDSVMDLTVTPEEAEQYATFETAAHMAREIEHIYPGVTVTPVVFQREVSGHWVSGHWVTSDE